MGVPKRKMSKMKKRQRIAANSYAAVQANFCANCASTVHTASSSTKPMRICTGRICFSAPRRRSTRSAPEQSKTGMHRNPFSLWKAPFRSRR